MLAILHGEKRFQVRASALVRSEEHVLLHRTCGDSFWTLPGGRVEFGEDSAATVVRELREELGVQTRCLGLAFVTETFFGHLGEEFHEVGFILFAELAQDSAQIDKSVIHPGIEADRRLEFRWFRESELQAVEVFPKFLRDAKLGAGDFPQYVVEREEAIGRAATSDAQGRP